MEKIGIIYRIADSMQKLIGFEVYRLDIQGYSYFENTISGFCGILDTSMGSYRIRPDGSFERIEK